MLRSSVAEINRDAFSLPKIGSWYEHRQGLEPDEQAMLNWLSYETNINMLFPDVLDLGVGAGRTVEPLCEVAKSYVGVDFSESMIALCRKRFPDKTFHVGDARNLAMFSADSFDIVFFSFNGIDYVDHVGRLAILAEVYRVLRPNGVFLFSTHNRAAKKSRWQGFSHLVWSIFHLPWLLAGKLRHLGFRSLETSTETYEIRNDTGHGHRMMTYYIDAEKQIEQLDNAGFDGFEIFDITGRRLGYNYFGFYNDSPWLSYFCRKY